MFICKRKHLKLKSKVTRYSVNLDRVEVTSVEVNHLNLYLRLGLGVVLKYKHKTYPPFDKNKSNLFLGIK